MDRSISDNASHIRNLKDVKELQLTKNSAFENWSAKKLADQYHDVNMAAYVCPVSGKFWWQSIMINLTGVM